MGLPWQHMKPIPTATASPWAGLSVTIEQDGQSRFLWQQHPCGRDLGGYHGNPLSQSHGNIIPLGGTKGSHGNTKGVELTPWQQHPCGRGLGLPWQHMEPIPWQQYPRGWGLGLPWQHMEPIPMATASPWAGLRVTIATRWAELISMATASLWAGLGVTMATHGANPMAATSLWAGLGVTMATHGANPHGNSIPVGGAKRHHSNKMGRADFYGNSIHVGGTWGLP